MSWVPHQSRSLRGRSFLTPDTRSEYFLRGLKIFPGNLRGTKIFLEILRGAKFSMTFPTVSNEMKKLRGMKFLKDFFSLPVEKNNKGYEIARLYNNRDNRD